MNANKSKNKSNFKVMIVGLILAIVFLVSACTNRAVDDGAINNTLDNEIIQEPRACTKEYMPVCGVDGQTYGNKCMAGNVGIAYEGECIKSVNMTNPASTFCVNNGGALEIRKDANGGEVGYCKLNGKECEEWSLFRAECAEIHVCTAEEKEAEICTLEYMPVCGNDGVTYGNGCGACALGANFYVLGECETEGLIPAESFCGTSTEASCETDVDCTDFGCSGQICGSIEESLDVVTTCEYRDCYDENKYDLSCQCVANKCKWD